ncbi:hypothetical protein DPMN_171260 [Dreissena polymorpha]|uniref:Uncharacterized protein n=1 Tax=Dreissena polymorpha TaxID=45954 RepID=A0A9D4DYL3_DREPO|nr:hypothetical protein DPMN_171260 [Dreissena polymorpha]
MFLQIFNVDETGWTGKIKSTQRFIALTDSSHVIKRKTSVNGHINVQVCVSGSGRFLPTMVVYKVSQNSHSR